MPRFATLLTILLLAASGARGQTPGDCTVGSAQGDLDVSNVSARVFNTGSLFYGRTSYQDYTVPRFSGIEPVYGAGFMLGAEVNGEVRVSSSRLSLYSFWPGPLNEDGTLPDPDDCSAYDRIYVVSSAEIARYEASGEASADLADWPVGLGAPSVDAGGQPLAVTSRDQTLNLTSGERPVLYGSQTAWWVMNDVGGSRYSDQTLPIGVEVRVSAFVIVTDDLLGAPEATFYRYEIVNRSANDITDMYAGFNSFIDLGDTFVYMGADSTRSMAYVYDIDETDSQYGIPPSMGLDLLSGASTVGFSTDDGPVNGPHSSAATYNRLQGLWSDGTPIREYDWGYGQPDTYPITRYAFPGDPVTEAFWSEENTDGNGANNFYHDRRPLIGSPIFNLASGESVTIDLAILFAQGTSRFDSVLRLRDISDDVQAAYSDGSLFTLGDELTTLPAPTPLAPEAGQYVGAVGSVTFSWEPVAGAEGYTLKWGASPEALTSQRITTRTETTVNLQDLVSGLSLQTFYWQVEPGANGAIGAASEVRSAEIFVPGVLRLASGAPAFVEVARGDGMNPCGPSAESPDGCDEVGGNLVYRSLNSTGQYYLYDRGRTFDFALASAAPNDFEIRFTAGGGLAISAPEDLYFYNGVSNVIHVPFEVWDIGSAGTGEDNDTTDDVRLIPVLTAVDADGSGPDSADVCAFDPSEIPESRAWLDGYVESDMISGYYPASSYEDFEGDFLAEVDAAPEECVEAGSRTAVFAYLRVRPYPPVHGHVFGSLASAPALPETGTTIRFYTTGDPPPVAAAPPPEASGGIALSIAPNPSRGAATVRMTLASPEAVRVRVLDMLGREVAVLAEGPQASGEITFKLPGDLAAGVYAVEASAGERRATRLVTVVR